MTTKKISKIASAVGVAVFLAFAGVGAAVTLSAAAGPARGFTANQQGALHAVLAALGRESFLTPP
jgi:hypothetical protein